MSKTGVISPVRERCGNPICDPLSALGNTEKEQKERTREEDFKPPSPKRMEKNKNDLFRKMFFLD
jgi:hypothetical protein